MDTEWKIFLKMVEADGVYIKGRSALAVGCKGGYALHYHIKNMPRARRINIIKYSGWKYYIYLVGR